MAIIGTDKRFQEIYQYLQNNGSADESIEADYGDHNWATD